MNDELQKALAAMLSKTTSAVEAGVGFLQAELPEVIQQLLMWHMVKSAVFFTIALSAFMFCAWALKRCWDNDEFDAMCFALIGAIVTFTVALCNITWLQILLAPKVYLIEYAASLAK